MRILGREFSVFSRLIQFPGPSKGAPETFDVTAPIQPVWDFSRQAELEAGGFSGLVEAAMGNLHAVIVGDLTNTFDIYASTNFFNRARITNPDRASVWLKQATVRIHNDLSTFTIASLILREIDNHAEFQEQYKLIATWNTKHGVSLRAGGTEQAAVLGAGGIARAYQVDFPVFIPPGCILAFTTTAGGAIESVTCDLLFQVVPRGVGPFGLR